MRIDNIFILIFFLLPAGLAAPLDFVHAAEPPKKVPVTLHADKLDYDRTNDVYVAEGHVKAEQDGMRLEADKVVFNNKTGEALAEGHVYLQEKGDIIRADSVQVNVNTKAGLIYNGDLFMSKDNLHLKGEKIERRSETEYHIEKGTFTTCDEGEWYLKADEIDVDMDRYATGKGVSFNMIGLPVFYTPYLLFPVRRQSGLLIPGFEYNSSEGFVLRNSIFWAISDFQDMTFYSDFRARHGLGSGVEYRYVNSRDSAGKFYFDYFNTFNEYRAPGTPDGRWLLSYQHHEEIADDLSIRADINLVSDFAYFRDLERRLELRSRPYLDSNMFYVERWDISSLYLLGQYAVDLTQKNNDKTIQKLPELRYSLFEERLGGPFHLSFEGSATNFSRQEADDVMRADFNPRISATFGSSGLNLTPRAGARATFYDRSGPNGELAEPIDRKYYYAEADLNGRFSRIYGKDRETGLGRMRHSIEPSVSYSYIPQSDRANIPQLDAIDAVGPRNMVSAALINRLTAHYKDAAGFRSFDMVIFRMSESYDLSSQNTGTVRAFSAIKSELYVKTPKLLTLSATADYDTHEGAFISSSESVAVTADTLRFNITHQYLRQPETKYLVGGAGTKIRSWDVDFQLWHDLVLQETTQQEYKFRYSSQCWGLGVMYVKKPGEIRYLLTLDLKGLGGVQF